MPTQNEERIVEFTKSQMFDLVSDIENYSEFLPWCNKSSIIKEENGNQITSLIADLEIGYNQFLYTYRSKVVLCKNKDFIKVTHIEGPFKYLVNEWKFIELSHSSSKIIFSIDFELKARLFNILINKFFNFAFQKMVDSFYDRAKRIYSK